MYPNDRIDDIGKKALFFRLKLRKREKDMATIKDKFSKGLTTINVKTNNFMEQNKINTHISTMENEICELMKQLGSQVYTKWLQNEFELSDVEEILNNIKEKYAEIEVQKEKIQQIIREEQQILGTNQGQETPQVNTIFCSNCGTPSAANFKFCTKCGSSLN